MLMSREAQKQIQKRFEELQNSQLTSKLCTILQNTSVMLTGRSTGGAFTGSGVLLYADTQYAYVVTAKHNLYSINRPGDPPPWDDNLVTAFQQKVVINYDDTGMIFGKKPAKKADINGITPVNQSINSSPPTPSWLYDVMILKSKDAGLITLAGKNKVYPLTGANQNVVMNANQYLKKGPEISFIQTGFGTNEDTTSNILEKRLPPPPGPYGTNKPGTLQYRFTKPLETNKLATVYNQSSADPNQYYQFQDAFQVEATGNDSTAPGDSGGPLFLIKSSGKSCGLYLIGVVTGSDMALSRTPCPRPGELLENNIVTSLEYWYKKPIF